MLTKSALVCRELSKNFGETKAADEITFELNRKDFLALVGPSGCGKTTLLRLIAGLESPDKGLLEIGGRTVASENKFVPPEERQVGIVFQDYALFPHMNIAENIAYGLSDEIGKKKRVDKMLSLIDLEGYGSRMPHELSGGEKQRVALARSLAPNPEILLLDEPFSNLDAYLRKKIREEVRNILNRAGATVIHVTHDQEEALFMGDYVGVMNEGRLEQLAEPEEIFHSPANPYVGEFIGHADFLEGKIDGKYVSTEIGLLPYQGKFSDGKSVKVMIRPDYLDIESNDNGTGVIINKTFQGMQYLYTIRLPSGKKIHTLQHHTNNYRNGEKVSFQTKSDHKVICFPLQQNR